MKTHPHISDLIGHISEPSRKPGEGWIDAHLSGCPECGRKASAIRAILSAGPDERIEPPPVVEYRIRTAYRKIAGEGTLQPGTPLFQRMLKPAAALLLIGFTTVAALLYLRGNNDTSPCSVPLSSRVINGSLTINNARSPRAASLRHNSVLRTSTHSIGKVYLGNRFAIRMAENTDLGVTSSVFIPKTGRYRFTFHLHGGTVHASFHNRTSRMEYTFSTPEAQIESTGTEFLLTSSQGKTSLVLVRGRTKITSRQTGSSIEAAPGSTYTIGPAITASKIQRNMIEAVYALRNADGPGLKMPGFLVNGKGLKRHSARSERMFGEEDRRDRIWTLPDAPVLNRWHFRPAKRHYSKIEDDDDDDGNAIP